MGKLKYKNKYISNKIFLPQYLIYKLNVKNIINKTLEIFPFLNVKFIKRINVRKSYRFFNFKKIKWKLKIEKYKIYL